MSEKITNLTSETNTLKGQLKEDENEDTGIEFDGTLGIAGGAALLSCAALVAAIVAGKKRAQPTTAALTNTTTAKVDC